MDRETVQKVCRAGVDTDSTEALFTFGDDSDERYTRIHDQLAEWGHQYLFSET